MTPHTGSASLIDLTKSDPGWPLSFKIRRGLWTYCLEPVVRWLPKSGNGARILALRAMGAKIGKGCRILPGVKVLMPWNLELEDNVWIGADCDIYNFSKVFIGRMSIVSQRSYLCTGTHDYTSPYMPLVYFPITVGRECWITAEVFISPGVTIADGCVIAARSVVTKDLLQPWHIYGGHPCRLIKAREMQRQVDTRIGTTS